MSWLHLIVDYMAVFFGYVFIFVGSGALLLGFIVVQYFIAQLVGRKTRALYHFYWYMAWRAKNNHKYPEMKQMLDQTLADADSLHRRMMQAKWQESVDCARMFREELDKIGGDDPLDPRLGAIVERMTRKYPTPKFD